MNILRKFLLGIEKSATDKRVLSIKVGIRIQKYSFTIFYQTVIHIETFCHAVTNMF